MEGRLQIRSYAKDGSKRWVTEVIVNHAEFIERKEQQAVQQPTPQSMESFGQMVPFDEEIPF